MPELMLKPGWPGTFRRTVTVAGKEPRVIEFGTNLPVEVSKEEMELLAPEIGLAIWPVERDDKKRPRYTDPVPAKKGQAAPLTFAEKKAARQAAVQKAAEKTAVAEGKAAEKKDAEMKRKESHER